MTPLPSDRAQTRLAEMCADDGFVTLSEACEHLRISRSHLYQLLHDGELPSARFGRSRRIPRAALRRFAAQRVSYGI